MASAKSGGTSNPFFETWNTPFDVPPFAAVKPEHFIPAFEAAMAEHKTEVEAVAADAAIPTFANTVEALERSGRALGRVGDVFGVLSGANTSEAIQAIEREIRPKLAAHGNAVRMNAAIYKRLEELESRKGELGLTGEQARVLERYVLNARRAGAHLDAARKERLAAIAEQLATLGTQFSQNVLADEQEPALVTGDAADLAGLPDFAVAAAKSEGEERKLEGSYVITLSRSSIEPFLQFATRRDLREKAWKAWIARGDKGGATDNKAIIAQTVALRTERAKLLGYDSFADYRLDDAMAKTPANVRGLLDNVWPRARRKALADRDAMQEMIREDGGNFAMAPWDWRFYSEKLRKKQCDIDEAETKPYLQLDRIVEAAFDTAHRLFGLSFRALSDVPVWHPDVRVWEVTGANGKHVGVFFGDYFGRSSKHSGAWMTTIRDQEKLEGDIRPLVVNVMNFAKAPDGQPTLLSFDDARTLFHEFGHGLHGLLSDVTYPSISGTGVLTDFVELPSQLYEHWLERPEVLRKFAVHADTGKPMPEDLLKRMLAARTFNQGFATVEYVASALVDLELHTRTSGDALDIGAFEKEALDKIGMPAEIVMRHRPTHFSHIFSGGGYASAYYSYMWSEVLDADAFAAFEETGDVFDAKTAKSLRDNIYAAGGARAPADAYTAFRGRLPTPEALLRRRGLIESGAMSVPVE